MAVGITDKMQGLTTVTLVVVVATGILTSVIGPTVLRILKIKDPVAVGLALGGTGHAVGTGTAFKYGQVAGAMAGLAIGVTGIMYVIVSPIVARYYFEIERVRTTCHFNRIKKSCTKKLFCPISKKHGIIGSKNF